ncbi:MAG: DUF99 family protein [Desulfurococcaceae archaeon]
MFKRTVEAYDDGFFPVRYKGGRGVTYIVGVEVSEQIDVRRIAWSMVRVDLNTTEHAITAISRNLKGSLILLDGVTYAGFDVVDPARLSNSTGKGVVVIQTHPLNLPRIRSALQKHFADWYERYRVIEDVYKNMIYVETPWRTIKIHVQGVDVYEAICTVKRLCLYSPVPEPLRIADKVSSALSRLLLRA